MTGEAPSDPTRRAWTRMALWGAAGLSLLPASLVGCKRKQTLRPTCYAPPPPNPKSVAPGVNEKSAGGDGVLARWAELGRIWRELGAHLRGKYEREEGERELRALEAEMASALDALPAWTELRTLFEERLQHVRESRYRTVTCYVPVTWSPMVPRGRVEKQLTELRKLADDGKLTKEAAEKAAGAVAVEAEYMTQLRAAGDDGEAARKKKAALSREYRDGKIAPGEGAERAGRHVVELEVDKPGVLTDADE